MIWEESLFLMDWFDEGPYYEITMQIEVKSCARRGQDHKMNFEKFSWSPIADSDGTVWTHWGLCPKAGVVED